MGPGFLGERGKTAPAFSRGKPFSDGGRRVSKAGTHRITLFEWLRGRLSFGVLFAHAGLFTGISLEMGGMRKFFGLFDGTTGFAVYVFMILSGSVIFYLLHWPVIILKCRLAP